MTTKEPAQNLEVEQQILGSLIKDSMHTNCRETLDSLCDDDFYSRVHRLIFRSIQIMTEKKTPVDLITLTDVMEKSGDDFGGFIYLAEMNKSVISIYNLPSYVSIVKKCAQLRSLQQIINNAQESINNSLDSVDIIEQLDSELKDAAMSSSGAELRHIKTIEGNWLDRLEERQKKGGAIAGLSTGINELDERISL